jgi:hypothetical protein
MKVKALVIAVVLTLAALGAATPSSVSLVGASSSCIDCIAQCRALGGDFMTCLNRVCKTECPQ